MILRPSVQQSMNAFPEITENLRNWTNTMQKHILTNAVSHGGCDAKCMFRNHVRKSVSNSHEFTRIHVNSRKFTRSSVFFFFALKKTKYVFSRFLQNSREIWEFTRIRANTCKSHAKFENSREFTLIFTKIDEIDWKFMRIDEIWATNYANWWKIDEN